MINYQSSMKFQNKNESSRLTLSVLLLGISVLLANPDAVAQVICQPGPGFEQCIADTYAPKYWFAGGGDRESNFPSDVEFMLNSSKLWGRFGCNRVLLDPANSILLPLQYETDCDKNTERFMPSDRQNPDGRSYFLDIPDELQSVIYPGKNPLVLGDAAVTLYANVVPRTDPVTSAITSYEMQYYTFYPRDKDHEGDWETVIVQVHPDGNPIGVFVYGHGALKGSAYKNGDRQVWFANDAGDEVRGVENWTADYSHPVVYVASGKHANYLTPGRHRHKAVVSIDHTNRGTRWNSHQNVVLLPKPTNTGVNFAWLSYAGKWGPRLARFRGSPRGVVTKGIYCFGHGGNPDAGDYPDHCSPECTPQSNWVKLYQTGDGLQDYFNALVGKIDKPAKSETDIYRAGQFPPFVNANYSHMDFNDSVGITSSCITGNFDYVMFSDKNYGGKVLRLSGTGNQFLLRDQPEMAVRVSSSAFDDCSVMSESWLAVFRNSKYHGDSYSTSASIPGKIDDFREVSNPIAEISSVRWCLPNNVNFVAYNEPNQQGDQIVFRGDGRINERDLSKKGENHPMHDRIASGEFVNVQPNPAGPGVQSGNFSRALWAATITAWNSDRDSGATGLGIQRDFYFGTRLRLQPQLTVGLGDTNSRWEFSLPVHWIVYGQSYDYYYGMGATFVDAKKGIWRWLRC